MTNSPTPHRAQASPAPFIAKRFAGETPKQRAKHLEIELQDRRARRKRRHPKNNVRICELERVLADRYGPVLPDDDAGRDDLIVLLHHLAHRDMPDRRMRVAVRRWVPWLNDHKTEKLIAKVMRKPLKWRADPLAKRIGLDDATRTRLDIHAIGATDFGKAKRIKRRKKRDAARHRALRAEAGAAPHATSAARLKPWVALKISRRTYYRRRRNGTDGTNSSAASPSEIVMKTNQCQGTPPPKGGSEACAVAGTGESLTVAARAQNNFPRRPNVTL
jgi:hypothetical protein